MELFTASFALPESLTLYVETRYLVVAYCTFKFSVVFSFATSGADKTMVFVVSIPVISFSERDVLNDLQGRTRQFKVQPKMVKAEILAGVNRASPFHIQWPRAGNPGAILEFVAPEGWIAFLSELDLSPYVPQIVSVKFNRAQRLYALSWIDLDLVKAGELVAITALELALKDRYAGQIPKRNPMLKDLLQHLAMEDGLDGTEIRFTRLYGGKVAELLYENETTRYARKAHKGHAQPTLLSIRNGLAHGDPFDGLPWGGLLELVRDLIEYAYRQLIAEGKRYDKGLI